MTKELEEWRVKAEAMEAQRNAAIERAKDLLREHGFAISVSGCGCCSSPIVRLTYRGEDILTGDGNVRFGMDDCNFDMFEDGEPTQ